MLRSDWMRFDVDMRWLLWNHFTLKLNMFGILPNMTACVASWSNIEKTYSSTAAAVKQQKVDSKVGYSQCNCMETSSRHHHHHHHHHLRISGGGCRRHRCSNSSSSSSSTRRRRRRVVVTCVTQNNNRNKKNMRRRPWAALEIYLGGGSRAGQARGQEGKHMMGHTCDLTLQKADSIRNKRRCI